MGNAFPDHSTFFDRRTSGLGLVVLVAANLLVALLTLRHRWGYYETLLIYWAEVAVLEDRGTNADDTLRTRATAERIYFDNVARTARLRMGEGNSLVGPNFEMRGCGDINYDLRTGESESIATCGEQFEIRYLRPNDAAEAPGQEPANDE